MSQHLNEPMTERGELAAPVVEPPSSNDTPVMPAARTAVPLPLIAHMVARLVGGQETATSEIPTLVEAVNTALARILQPTATLPAAEDPEEVTVRRERPRLHRHRDEADRGPGRPRRIAAATPV